MPVGKSSIKRMNASQETEEKKNGMKSVEEGGNVINGAKVKETATKKTASSTRQKTISQKTVKKTVQKKLDAGKTGEDLGQTTQKKEMEQGVVSKITCELPIYLM